MSFTVSIEGYTRPYVQGELRRRRVEPASASRSPHPIRDKSRESKEDEGPDPSAKKQPSALRRYEAVLEEVERQAEPRLAITADDIMSTNVVTMTPDTSIDDAWQSISEHRFRHVPVVSANGQLVGILSDRDLLRSLLRADKDRPLSEIMSQPVLSAESSTEIRQIARVMFEEHLGSMPVLDADHQLIGIITRSDILRALIEHMPLELWA